MLKSDLKVPSSNSLSTFIPFLRTKDKHYKICWDTILGYFVHAAYNKSLLKIELDGFKDSCEQRFSEILDEPSFWSEIEAMYFENEELFKISPELLMFKATKGEIDPNSEKLGDTLIELLNGFSLSSSQNSNLNILAKEIKANFDTFNDSTRVNQPVRKSKVSYLPYLTSHFQQDLKFLNSRPNYLVTQFPAFIKLYSFLYVSQIALNIRDWKGGEPSHKPCFFIVDNERASRERTQVQRYGHAQLVEYLEYLFPYLVMNEALQDKGNTKPLWYLAKAIRDDKESLGDLNLFAQKFCDARSKYFLTPPPVEKQNDTDNAIEQMLKLSLRQFEKKNGTLEEYNQAAVKGVLNTICAPFIQKRGQAGQVLTFNQDYIVLLTNLAIGENEKLRLHELIKAFESRGIYFDKQSQQNLVNFYERMGIVERMSDSGDAVYVKKTV